MYFHILLEILHRLHLNIPIIHILLEILYMPGNTCGRGTFCLPPNHVVRGGKESVPLPPQGYNSMAFRIIKKVLTVYYDT